MPSIARPAALGLTLCLALAACGTPAPTPDASAPSPTVTMSASADPIELLTTALAKLDEQSFRVSGDLDSDLGWCHVDWSIDPTAGTATATFEVMVTLVDGTGQQTDGTLSTNELIIDGDDLWEHQDDLVFSDSPDTADRPDWLHNASGAEDAIVTSPSEALAALFVTDDSTIEYDVDTGLTMRNPADPYSLFASHCSQPEEKAPPVDLRMTLDDQGRPVVLSGETIELTFVDYGRDVDATEPDGTIAEGAIVHDGTDPTEWNLTPRLGP